MNKFCLNQQRRRELVRFARGIEPLKSSYYHRCRYYWSRVGHPTPCNLWVLYRNPGYDLPAHRQQNTTAASLWNIFLTDCLRFVFPLAGSAVFGFPQRISDVWLFYTGCAERSLREVPVWRDAKCWAMILLGLSFRCMFRAGLGSYDKPGLSKRRKCD